MNSRHIEVYILNVAIPNKNFNVYIENYQNFNFLFFFFDEKAFKYLDNIIFGILFEYLGKIL
jgi:hypothetical protein